MLAAGQQSATRAITLSPDLAEASRGRAFIGEIASQAGFPEECVFDIIVSCSEAIANAIEHSPIKGEVQVRTILRWDRLEVEIQGPGEFQAPDRLRKRETRGLGLPLMAKLSDHLALFSGPNGETFVSLTFYRPGVEIRDEGAVAPTFANLAEENRLLDDILKNFPDAFFVLDHEGRFVYLNPEALDRVDSSLDDLIGRDVWEVFPDFAPKLRQAFEAAETERSVRQVTAATPDDHWREWTAFPVEDGLAIWARDITERKKAEEARQESEDRLRAVLGSAVDMLYRRDLRTDRFEYVSPSAEKVVGYSPEEVTAMSPAEAQSLMHPDDVPAFRAALAQLQESGEAGAEYRQRAPDGTYHWLSNRMTVDRDEADTPVYRNGSIRDITERKQAEEALRTSRATFAELIERSPFGTYVVDSAFRIAFMNASSQTGAFRNVRPLIGRPFTEAMHTLWPDDVAEDIISHFRHTLETGEPYYSPRFTNPRHDVEIVESYEWELQRIALPDGQWSVICYYFDSTELRQAQEALATSEARYRGFFENSQESIIVRRLVFNEKGDVVDMELEDVNPAGLAALGFASLEEGKGRRYSTFLSPAQFRSVLHDVRELRAAGKPVTKEMHLDANNRDYLATMVQLGDRVLTTGTDITERKQEETEREATLALLGLMNSQADLRTLMGEAALLFREVSGCEAVGVRLQQGEDFPYFETRGFPDAFVEMERSLCARDRSGNILHDAKGYPIHECMCGNIIHGRFDPELPFFTTGGSFCSNCTTELLATSTEAERQARTRDRCNGEGYESVALIPLRAGGETYGLLQLNDRRCNCFTAASIRMFENLAATLAAGLAERRAREALRDSEERFRTMADAIPQLAWMANADGYIHWYNRRWYEYTGTTPAEMEGWGWQSVHDREALPGALKRWQESIATGEPFDMEFPLRGADGQFRMFLTRVMPQKDAAGHVVQWFGTNTDVSERARAEQEREQLLADEQALTEELAAANEELLAANEELAATSEELTSQTEELVEREHALRDSEERFHTMVDAMPQLAWIAHADGYIYWYNRRWYEYTGTTPEEMEGWGWQSVHDPQALPGVLERWQESIRTGEPFDMEFPLRGADGEFRPFLTRVMPQKDAAGHVVQWFGTNTDVSERARAEEARRKSEESLGGLLASIGKLRLFERRKPWQVLLVGIALQVVLFVGVDQLGSPRNYLGIPGAVTAFIGVLAAITAGPITGMAVALAGGVAYIVFITDFGSVVAWPAIAVSIILWTLLAGLAGLGADWIRQKALQREALLGRMLADRETLTDSLAAANAGLSTRNEELALREQELWEAQAETTRLLDEQILLFRRLQESLLDIPAELSGVKFGHLYRSATEQAQVGGDFYDVFEVKEGRIGILMGDVAGHGIEAARTATLVKDVVHAFVHQTLRTHEVLRRTNSLLIEKHLSGFVTLFLGILDPRTGELRYSSAGHPDMLVRRASAEIEHLGAGSSPLGIYADAGWKPYAVELEAHDLLVLFTDGVIEARHNGELFGEKRLDSLIKRKRLSPERLPQAILDQVLAFSEGTLQDDVAILALLVAEKANGGKADAKPFKQRNS